MSVARKVTGSALDFIHERRKRELQSVSENGQNRGKNRADCALQKSSLQNYPFLTEVD